MCVICRHPLHDPGEEEDTCVSYVAILYMIQVRLFLEV
jgi:hypothetical protein